MHRIIDPSISSSQPLIRHHRGRPGVRVDRRRPKAHVHAPSSSLVVHATRADAGRTGAARCAPAATPPASKPRSPPARVAGIALYGRAGGEASGGRACADPLAAAAARLAAKLCTWCRRAEKVTSGGGGRIICTRRLLRPLRPLRGVCGAEAERASTASCFAGSSRSSLRKSPFRPSICSVPTRSE